MGGSLSCSRFESAALSLQDGGHAPRRWLSQRLPQSPSLCPAPPRSSRAARSRSSCRSRRRPGRTFWRACWARSFSSAGASRSSSRTSPAPAATSARRWWRARRRTATRLMLTTSPFTQNVSLFKSVPYDPVADFAPIIQLVDGFMALAVHPSVPATSAQDFVDYVKARPGELNYASPGRGTPHHLAMELFKLATGTDLKHVPYRGSAPAVQDLVGGHVSAMFIPVHVGLPLAKDNQIRLLAVAYKQRVSVAPEVPTLPEQGIKGVDIDFWLGMLAPAATPREIVARYNTVLNEILRSPQIVEKLTTQGFVGVGGTRGRFRRADRQGPCASGARSSRRPASRRSDRQPRDSPANEYSRYAPSMRDAQVIIVGGGPVGMGLAIELGQRNVRCIVVERYAQPQPIPKGQNLTQRTMEHFHFWGVENDVRAARTIPPEYGIGGLTAYGTLLGDYSYDWMQRELVRPFYFTDNERLPQYATESVLRRRAAELASVETLYGWSAEEVSQDDRGVERRDRRARRRRPPHAAGRLCRRLRRQPVDDASAGRHHPDPFRPRPADGAAGLPLARAAPAAAAISRQVVLQRPASRPGGLLEVLRPGRPRQHVVLPRSGPAGDHQGQFRLPPASPCGGRRGIRRRVRAHRLLGAALRHRRHLPQGAHLHRRRCGPQPSALWRLRRQHGPRGREQPRLEARRRAAGLGGAKACSSPTTRSGGPCSSRRRATSSRRPSRPTASSWRRSTRSATRTRSSANGTRASRARAPRSTPSSRTTRAPRSCAGLPGSRCSALGSHAFAARAGHHLAPQPLSSGRNVFEELGDGFTLLSLDGDDTICGAFETAAEQMRIPLTVIADSRRGGRERYDAAYVLVRPDQFVAWAGNDGSVDAVAILRKAIGGRD